MSEAWTLTIMHVDIYEIRRQNLERLLRTRGMRLSDFSKATDVSAIYLTQVLSDRTQRHLGDRVARRIEQKSELPAGWLDQVNSATSTLSERAVDLAQKLDDLPDSILDKIAAEIDTLHRYHADK